MWIKNGDEWHGTWHKSLLHNPYWRPTINNKKLKVAQNASGNATEQTTRLQSNRLKNLKFIQIHISRGCTRSLQIEKQKKLYIICKGAFGLLLFAVTHLIHTCVLTYKWVLVMVTLLLSLLFPRPFPTNRSDLIQWHTSAAPPQRKK